MAKPKHINLTEDGVITQEALLAYAEGRLSDAERTQLDQLLRDDPFAQDALEGMRISPAPAEIPAAISSINTLLRERAGMRERKKKGIEIHWANYAYAAVVIGVLIGVGYVMIHIYSNKHEEIAMTKAVPQAQESIPIVEEKKKETPLVDTAAIQRSTDSTSVNPAALTVASTGATNGGTYAYSSSDADKDQKPTANTTADDKAAASNLEKMAPATKPSPAIGGEVAAQLGVARTFFEAGNYVDAEKRYNEILASQPDNADALYFGGISSYLNGSKGSGEANFDKLAKSGLYPEGTKWYKANILLKKGKKEEAKKLLLDLVNTNSIFKDRAIKLYEELYTNNSK